MFHCRAPLALASLTSTVIVLAGCSDVALQAGGGEAQKGMAKLTVANAGAIANIVNSHKGCGFASPEVLEAAEVIGEVGETGSLVLTADCAIPLTEDGRDTRISEGDCTGEGAQIATGALHVRATRTMTGLVTGDAENPILPAGPEAVLLEIEADFEQFGVYTEGSANALTLDEGTIRFNVQPKLAESTDPDAPGICAAPTGNSKLSDIRFADPVVVSLETDSWFQPITATIDELNLQAAYNGRWDATFENHIVGQITVNGSKFELDEPLDPEYDAAAFFEGWASCEPEGFGEDPEVRMVKLIDGEPNYQCTNEIPAARLGDGLARLSVSSFGQIVQLIQADTNCGFSSQKVLDAGEVTETGGGRGSITWRVEQCPMAFPLDTVVDTSCDGVDTKVSGSVTVSGTFTLEGRLTGNPDNPVLPLSSDAATIDLTEVAFDHFTVKTDRPEFLTQKTGTFAGTLKPRLAVGESTGACSVPTPNVVMEGLTYTSEAEVRVFAPQGQFDATIQAGSFRAVNGAVGDEVDVFEGTITVNDEELTVPDPSEHQGLQPGFDLEEFEAGYECTEDLALPAKFDGCQDLEAELISGAARLTVNHLGAVASLLQADEGCGFSAPDVIDAVQTSGELGKQGGQAVYTIDGCTLDFPEPTVVDTDCNGEETVVQGTVTASGTLTLSGWLASPDDKVEPIVPDTWTPAELDLALSFDEFSVKGGRDEYLTARSGTLSGVIQPQTAIDTVTGACSLPTSNAELSDMSWSADTELQVNSGDTYVVLDVEGADLLAVNGAMGSLENHLEGTLTLDGESFEVPYDTDDNSLVPDYDPVAHMEAFSCTEDMALPSSTDECSFHKTIGEGSARLIIQAMGEAASKINSDADCGFENTLDILRNSDQEPEGAEFGETGTLTFYTDQLIEEYPDGCPMSFDGSEPDSVDCLGGEKYVDGTMTVRSTRVVAGEFEEICVFVVCANGIIPHDHNEVDVSLDEVTFTDFSQWSYGPGGEPPPGILTIPDGTGSGQVFPILGAQADDPERFMVATPVAYLRDISFSSNEVTLEAEGKTFKFSVDSTDLTAFNGSWAGDDNWDGSGANGPLWGYDSGSVFPEAGPYENFIEGSITVDGVTIDMDRQGLVPGFEAQSFEDAYNCEESTPNLLAPVPQAGE